MGLDEFRRQLEYKAAQREKTVIVVIRWYPSSKICSERGYKMPLSVREWTCPACHIHHDRAINAAINLQKVAETNWTASPGNSMDRCPSVSASMS